MYALWNILNKTFVREYYRLNAGLLFVVMMFAGGFLRAEDHIALSSYVITSPFLLAVVFFVWLLYHFKTVFFIHQHLLQNSHQFIYHFGLISIVKRIVLWYFVQLYLWLPVLLYASFMIWCGFQIQAWNGIVAVAIFILFTPTIGIFAYEYRLARPNPDYKIGQISTYFNRKFKKPVWSYFLFYLLNEEITLLITTKITALIVLGLCRLYPTDSYDQRLLSLGGLFVALGHLAMLLRLYEFEHLKLPILRNLPIGLTQRFLQYSILFFLLILPETIILIRNLPPTLNGWYVVQWTFLVLGLFWLFFARFLIKHHDINTVSQQGFWVLIVGFFVIMFRIPIPPIAFSCGIVAFWWFKKSYYDSDFIQVSP